MKRATFRKLIGGQPLKVTLPAGGWALREAEAYFGEELCQRRDCDGECGGWHRL